MGTQRQNLASVVNWFPEAEPDPREGQHCLPRPFLPKRKRAQDFPGSRPDEERGAKVWVPRLGFSFL